MVEHLVLFKIKSGTPQSAIDALVAGLQSLKDAVPGVVWVTTGANFTDRGKGYNHGLVVRLESREALDNYRAHPAHVRVVEELIKPIIDDLLAVDYEI